MQQRSSSAESLEVTTGELRIGEELSPFQELLKEWFFTCYFLGAFAFFVIQLCLWFLGRLLWIYRRRKDHWIEEPSYGLDDIQGSLDGDGGAGGDEENEQEWENLSLFSSTNDRNNHPTSFSLRGNNSVMGEALMHEFSDSDSFHSIPNDDFDWPQSQHEILSHMDNSREWDLRNDILQQRENGAQRGFEISESLPNTLDPLQGHESQGSFDGLAEQKTAAKFDVHSKQALIGQDGSCKILFLPRQKFGHLASSDSGAPVNLESLWHSQSSASLGDDCLKSQIHEASSELFPESKDPTLEFRSLILKLLAHDDENGDAKIEIQDIIQWLLGENSPAEGNTKTGTGSRNLFHGLGGTSRVQCTKSRMSESVAFIGDGKSASSSLESEALLAPRRPVCRFLMPQAEKVAEDG